MAFTTIQTTDTLEQMRVKLNTMTQTDFGDPADLTAAGLSATSVIGAVVELNSIVTAAAGWVIEDSTSTIQAIGSGQTLKVFGTSNQINAIVSVPDTLTISLPNDVTIANDLTVTNDLTVSNDLSVTNNVTASGSTHTLGTIEISGNTIRSVDSTKINVNDVFRANEIETQDGLLRFDKIGAFPRIQSTKSDKVVVFDAVPAFNDSIIFEGSTPDDNELTVTVTDPTADQTITIPDETGTIITTGSTDAVSETMMANDAIGEAELKSVVNLQILNSSGSVLKSIFGAGA
tara:strand:+ start:1023 stop:1889 length:867 start_codon:yes stop_codon:yes gene_type:complete